MMYAGSEGHPGGETHIQEQYDVDEEDEEVVPASAPPDARGQVPFVFDATYEVQNALRLRQAVDEMRQQATPPEQAQAPLQQQVSPYAAPGLEATRSGSGSSSASEGLERGLGLALALDESWKGHAGSSAGGQIPEVCPNSEALMIMFSDTQQFPETFYEPSRARLAERGTGVRRSTYG